MTDQPVSPYAGARVTAVVVTFNRLDLLRGLLERLESVPGLTEVLVVDNASTDGTGEWLAGLADRDPAGDRATVPVLGRTLATNGGGLVSRVLRRQHDDESLGVLALRLTDQAGVGDRVMHDLSLEGAHRFQTNRLAGAFGLVGRLRAEVRQRRASSGPVTRNIQHQSGAVTCLTRDRESR